MRYDAPPLSGLPTVVKNLLIINVLVFLVTAFGLAGTGERGMYDHFALHYFASPLFEPWQLVTHMFMHGGFGHLALNMFVLFMLGPPLEHKWGSQRFLTYYMIAGVGAALFYSGAHAFDYFKLKELLSEEQFGEVMVRGGDLWQERRNFAHPEMGRLNQLLNMPMVGASGAIYGVLLAFGMTFPDVRLILFPIFIPIKAKYMVVLLGVMAVLMSMADNPDDNVAHLAHLGGMVVGFLLIKLWKDRGDMDGWQRWDQGR